MSNKKQIGILLSFIIILGLFYSVRPLTIHVFGEKFQGVVLKIGKAGTKGGVPKFVKYIRNNRVFTQITNDYHVNKGDVFNVYFKKYFFGEFDFVGDKFIASKNIFFIFSESVPKNVELVSILKNNKLIKIINVKKLKNFGVIIDDKSTVIVKYDSIVRYKIETKFSKHNFFEITD